MQEVFEKIIERLESKYTEAVCKKSEPCDYPETIGCCYDKAINKAVEIVKQAATEYNNGWIPVESGLPERNKPVLVYAESKTISGGTITMVGACDNGFWFIQNGVDTLGFPCRDYKVIAWQPLPEPYQQKGE